MEKLDYNVEHSFEHLGEMSLFPVCNFEHKMSKKFE